jgi:tyrosine-protein kinase
MPYPADDPAPISLGEFQAVLRRRKWWVIVPTLLAVAGALGYVYLRTPVYSSTARVEVLPTTALAALTPGTTSFANMDTESARVESSQVQLRAADLLATRGQQASLATDADISVTVPTNTTYLDITCTLGDPSKAQACAQAYADAYVADRKDVADQAVTTVRGPLDAKVTKLTSIVNQLNDLIAATTDPVTRAELVGRQTRVQTRLVSAQSALDGLPRAAATPADVATPADLPTSPSNKNYLTIGILAALLGLAIGVGLAFIRQRMDARVGEHEGLDAILNTPVLAVVPHVKGPRKARGSTVVTISDPDGRAAEAFRSARPVLLHRAAEHEVSTILVTGPGQGEGKSTTVANLGVVLAQAGYRVAMLSCDLRKPALHRFFGASSEPGLSEVLKHQSSLRKALVKTDVPNLLLLPSGAIPGNPAELLGSSSMQAVVDELRANADFVLLDSPPSLVVADALELSSVADAVLVVVDGSSTTEADVGRIGAQLDQVGARLLGCMLNNMDPKAASRYGAYYSTSYRYASRRSEGRRWDDAATSAEHHATLPRGTQVDVDLGPEPFEDAGDVSSANGKPANVDTPVTDRWTSVVNLEAESESEPPTDVPDAAEPNPDPESARAAGSDPEADGGMWR